MNSPTKHSPLKQLKKVVIAPHIDDEVLGCGGILDDNTFILYCGVEDRSYVNKEERIEEMEKVRKFLGFKYQILDNEVNNYNLRNLIGSFEKIINKHKPDMVFIPHPSYNQDHREVHEAALTSLRPHDQIFFVKKVLVYEQPHTFQWDHNEGSPININYFVPIDIEKKIKAYTLMKSQVRSFRSPELVRAIAFVRGDQAKCNYAEGFEILRWID
jgi:LmbE family N-acetylglucosaminyl deacetylase